jgi:putative hydrolase of the HAD superfamily
MIKVIIFDAVGLFTRQEPLSIGLERDHGIPLEKSLPFFKGALQDCVAGRADLKEVLPPYLDSWGWDGGVDAILKYWFERDHKIDEDLVSYVKDLREKGMVCVLGTNNEKYRVAYMLDKMGFSEIFDKAYSSAHIGHKKPSLEFYQKIFSDLENIKKEEVLFWDDKLENIEAAQKFGILGEVYTTFTDFKEKMKQYLD